MTKVSRIWRCPDEWIEHATSFAKSLNGREMTPVEKKFRDEHEDPWDYFRVFGIQPETQHYIDQTIIFLESADPKNTADLLTYLIRLGWSAEELLRKETDNGSNTVTSTD